TGICVEGNDIDTDRIIPARFMKEITFANMGRYAFYDQRFDERGAAKPHPFNDPRFQGARLLIVNKNFGCGSSREHAPQALMRSGIRAVLGESFAEIFAGNCTAMGVPTVTASESEIADLMAAVRQTPALGLRLSLADRTLSYHTKRVPVCLSDVVRRAFLEGTWDSTSLMLANLDQVRRTAGRLAYLNRFSQ
ncbi:MAG: hypothetical protein A3I06_06255, partial [Candidatus Lindowbacteria bacterium RIFCSPLOWO2_02_FULL_62_12]